MIFKKSYFREFLDFNRSLSLMLVAKLNLIQAVEIIRLQLKAGEFRSVIDELLRDLKTGSSFSAACAKRKDIFPEVYVANIKIAEETGELSGIISEYTAFEEKYSKLKQKISHALRYPVFIIFIAVAAVAFLLFFLIPTFETLFSTMNAELPPVTKALMDISGFLTDNGIWIILIVGLLFFSASRAVKTEYVKENYIDRMALSFPLISGLFRINLLARFSLSMSILIRSRVRLTDALKIAMNISGNKVFRNEINGLVKNLVKGESIAGNVKKSIVFDSTFTRLLIVGEQTAELDKIFSLLSEYYTNEFDSKLETITSMIEPVLILFIGLIVAFILIAMYLPMFEMVNVMGA